MGGGALGGGEESREAEEEVMMGDGRCCRLHAHVAYGEIVL